MSRLPAAAVLLSGLMPLPGLADAPLVVRIVTAQVQPTVTTYAISGTVTAPDSVAISARDGGRVIAVGVQVGDHIAPGQVLVQLDPTQANAAARAAEAQLAAADAGLRQARQARDRAAGLAERGAGTVAGLDAATEALLAAQSARDQALAQVSKARQAVDDTVIRAGAAGIITGRTAEPGQIVAAAQGLLTLAPDGAREAVFHAPDGVDLREFIGRRVVIRSLDAPFLSVGGAVSEISPLADSASGTVEVKARIDVDAAQPGLGVPVMSEIDLRNDPVVSLPWTALAAGPSGAAVWTVDPATQKVALTPVTVARYTADTIELSRGLVAGQLVVADGSHLLYPGRQVVAAGGKP